MKSFSYVAQDAKNKQVKGIINAENEQEFLKKVKEKGLYVKDYKESDSTDSKSLYKFNTKELAFCCRQLSAMLTSGLTLVKSIDILCKEQEGEPVENNDAVPAQAFIDEIREIAYWYVSDYYEPEAYDKVAGMVCPERDFATRIVMESDLSDLRYLYYYGEYVSENEIRTAAHLAALPDETIRLMADTYTEGYRIGFEVCNKDISIKKTVNILSRL